MGGSVGPGASGWCGLMIPEMRRDHEILLICLCKWGVISGALGGGSLGVGFYLRSAFFGLRGGESRFLSFRGGVEFVVLGRWGQVW